MPSRPQAGRYAGILAAMILASLLCAQSIFTYSDSKGDIAIRAKDGKGSIITQGYQFDLKGTVSISSKSRKFTLQAPAVTAKIGQSKGATSPDDLKSAQASGGVRLQQSAKSAQSNLQANTVLYTAGQAKRALVSAKGSVRIQNVDTAKRQTMIATGSSGTASLNPDAKRGVEKAILNGPVRVELVQSGDKGSTVVFTGNKLTLDGDTIRMTGNVKASGKGASRFGNLSSVDTLTIQLNDKGEMKTFNFSSGGDE